MAAASPAASPVHVGVLVNPEDKQLKTVAHSLLESKLEKMLSSAAPPDDPRRTKKQAIDWIKQWDLDGDGIISGLEMQGAAMQHAKLQMSYKSRGGWLVFLVVLAICCFAVILGLSVWANDVSQEAKGTSGRSDLGGFTLRKKDSAAVVKTGTALYEFKVERIGYLPFDELSQITGIGFLWKRALHFMDVEGFQWSGSGNVTFFSTHGTVLTIVKPTDNTSLLLLQEPGDAAPQVMYQGPEELIGLDAANIDRGLLALKASSIPVTPFNFWKYMVDPYVSQLDMLPDMCMEQGTKLIAGNITDVHETCAVAIMILFQGFGIVEAGVGPQDYFNLDLSSEEAAALKGSGAFSQRNIFDPTPEDYKDRFLNLVQARIDLMPH